MDRRGLDHCSYDFDNKINCLMGKNGGPFYGPLAHSFERFEYLHPNLISAHRVSKYGAILNPVS